MALSSDERCKSAFHRRCETCVAGHRVVRRVLFGAHFFCRPYRMIPCLLVWSETRLVAATERYHVVAHGVVSGVIVVVRFA